MPRFSIIVAVYNAEQYLDECLDSICGQTCGDFEVICINDGSTDSSREILSDRSFSDARIRVIDKANGGPSSARNDGLRISQGEYVARSLGDYLRRHPAIDSPLTRGGSVRYLTTEQPTSFSAAATIFVGQPVEAEHIDL